MRVSVAYLFPAGLTQDRWPLDIELPPDSTIGDLLACLLEKYGEAIRDRLVQEKDGSPYVTFLINGEQVELDHVLEHEDHVLIMPPIAGG